MQLGGTLTHLMRSGERQSINYNELSAREKSNLNFETSAQRDIDNDPKINPLYRAIWEMYIELKTCTIDEVY